MMNNLVRLLKVNLKNDVKMIVIWLIIILTMMISGLVKLVDLYGTTANVKQLGAMLDTTMMTALFAKIPEVTLNTAILFGTIMLPLMGVLMALMNIQMVLRNTRQMEEAGETELLLSNAMRTETPLLAAVIEMIIVNILSAFGVYLTLWLIPMRGGTISGNALFAILVGLSGLFFAGIMLVVTQCFAESRSVQLFSYSLLGLFYLLRAGIDVQNWQKIKWISPFNWLEDSQVYYGNFWQYTILLGLIFLACIILSIILVRHRDLGFGIFKPTGRGREHAPWLLRSWLTLYLRLESKIMWGWGIGIGIMAVMFGGLFSNVSDMLKNNTAINKIIGGTANQMLANELNANFLVMISMFISFLAVIAGWSVIQRYQYDVKNGYLELLGAQPLSRSKMYLTYTIMGAIFAIIYWIMGIMIVFGVANLVLDHPMASDLLSRTVWGYLPAILLFSSLSSLILGWYPKLFGILYLYGGVMFLLTYLKNLFDLPLSLLKFSPYGWIYNLPVTHVSNQILWGMLGVTSILWITGLVGFKRRDLI